MRDLRQAIRDRHRKPILQFDGSCERRILKSSKVSKRKKKKKRPFFFSFSFSLSSPSYLYLTNVFCGLLSKSKEVLNNSKRVTANKVHFYLTTHLQTLFSSSFYFIRKHKDSQNHHVIPTNPTSDKILYDHTVSLLRKN